MSTLFTPQAKAAALEAVTLTDAEAARFTNLSSKTLARHAEAGEPVGRIKVGRRVLFLKKALETWIASNDPAAHNAGRILLHGCNYFQRDRCLIGDAGAVATVIDPAGATFQRHPLTVELTGSATRGMTVLDRRPAPQRAALTDWWPPSPAN